MCGVLIDLRSDVWLQLMPVLPLAMQARALCMCAAMLALLVCCVPRMYVTL
jgi:hypothetical protein